MFRKQVHFTVNGEFLDLSGAEAFAPLSDTLRYRLRKTGTKVVCAEGDCGACTVMFRRINDPQDSSARFHSINSCIFPSFLADGCHIVTVEGLAQGKELHEIQESMVRNFGGQCGFCTPGFVMSIANLYEHKANPSEQNIKNYLTGNLCRCTGYQPIITAALAVDSKKIRGLAELYPLRAESEALAEKIQTSLLIETPEKIFFAPRTLAEAVEFRTKYPRARIFSGATDIGVQINKGRDVGAEQMSLHLVDELYRLEQDGDSVHVGARVTLGRLLDFIEDRIPAFANFLNIFASPQIKNSATLIGNLANGSPIADTTPFLLTMDAEKTIIGKNGKRNLAITQFFKGYKTFALEDSEFISSVRFRVPDLKKTQLGLYKISQRRDLDISCVNASFLFEVKSGKVSTAKIAYGGVGEVPLRLYVVEKKLEQQTMDKNLVRNAKQWILESIQPISDVRGTSEFRKQMAVRLFEKFAQEYLGL